MPHINQKFFSFFFPIGLCPPLCISRRTHPSSRRVFFSLRFLIAALDGADGSRNDGFDSQMTSQPSNTEITQSMKQAIVVSESTLYPVLRRLQKGNYCQTYDEPYQGRNRRYYSITEEGKAKLEEYKLQWIDYKTAIETFLGDGGDPAGQSGPGGSDAGNGTAGGSGSGNTDAGNTHTANQNKVGGEEHE